jgi:hypothetical protein
MSRIEGGEHLGSNRLNLDQRIRITVHIILSYWWDLGSGFEAKR